jgi:signal peptidase I
MKVDRADAHRFYRGASMAGTFRPGDRLTVAPVPLIEIEPGDVVVLRGPDGCGNDSDLVHRVVAAAPDGLVARGDSNPCDDEGRVTAANLVGRVTHFERKGRTRRVRGGRWGLLRARLLHARLPAWGLVKQVGRRPYRWLRASGLVQRCWRPAVTRVRFTTEDGPLVKYVCGGRMVASWWPEEGRFECRRPYDLIIERPEKQG